MKIIDFSGFFSFFAKNDLKFFVFREKSKCKKNGNHISSDFGQSECGSKNPWRSWTSHLNFSGLPKTILGSGGPGTPPNAHFGQMGIKLLKIDEDIRGKGYHSSYSFCSDPRERDLLCVLQLISTTIYWYI